MIVTQEPYRVAEDASNKPDASTAYNLPGTAVTHFRTFTSQLANGDVVRVLAAQISAGFAVNGPWEIVDCTFTTGSPDTLVRTTLVASSTGSKIDWSAGSVFPRLVNIGVRSRERATTSNKSSGYTVVAGDYGNTLRCTAALTLTFPASSGLADGWYVDVIADGGIATLTPNGSETINQHTKAAIPDGGFGRVSSNGSNLFLSTPSGRFLLQEIDVSSAASADTSIAMVDGFDYFLNTRLNWSPSAAPFLRFREIGGTWRDTASSYRFAYVQSASTLTSNNNVADDKIRLWSLDPSSIEIFISETKIVLGRNASFKTSIITAGHITYSAGSSAEFSGGQYNTAEAHDLVRLAINSSTFGANSKAWFSAQAVN